MSDVTRKGLEELGFVEKNGEWVKRINPVKPNVSTDQPVQIRPDLPIRPVPINNFDTITTEEYKKKFRKKEGKQRDEKGRIKSKMGNVRTTYNGVEYDSTKEANFAKDLDWQLRAASIRAWERQVKIEIKIDEFHICNYKADFKVYYCDDSIMFFDIKGRKEGLAYELFKIKRKLIKKLYAIEIYEV